MITCSEFNRIFAEGLPSAFKCTLGDNRLSIRTPLMYPNGAYVVVYIEETELDYRITDLGGLVHFWVSEGIYTKLSRTRQIILDDIMLTNTVRFIDDEIFTGVDNVADIPFAIMRVAQTVARASDIVYTKRITFPETFNASVSDFFIENKLDFVEQYSIEDPYGELWMFDFLIHSGHKKLIKTIATDNKSYSEALVNRTIRQWDAVKRVGIVYEKITVYDSSRSVWKETSLLQLKEHCKLIPFERRYDYVDFLAS